MILSQILRFFVFLNLWHNGYTIIDYVKWDDQMNKIYKVLTSELNIKKLTDNDDNFVGVVRYDDQIANEKELIYQTLLAMGMPKEKAKEVNNLSWLNDVMIDLYWLDLPFEEGKRWEGIEKKIII